MKRLVFHILIAMATAAFGEAATSGFELEVWRGETAAVMVPEESVPVMLKAAAPSGIDYDIGRVVSIACPSSTNSAVRSERCEVVLWRRGGVRKRIRQSSYGDKWRTIVRVSVPTTIPAGEYRIGAMKLVVRDRVLAISDELKTYFGFWTDEHAPESVCPNGAPSLRLIERCADLVAEEKLRVLGSAH